MHKRIMLGTVIFIIFIGSTVTMVMINSSLFFNAYRQQFGGLNNEQVQGINNLILQLSDSDFTPNQIAYILATVYHETGQTFQPIREYGRGRGKAYGTTYYGRGYVQLTWKRNYERFGVLLDIDLVNNPDLALNPDVAYKIAALGMKKGLFTGVGLNRYINDTSTDYVGARRIINGTDRAQLIAGYAKKFEEVIKTALALKTNGVVATPVPKSYNSLQSIFNFMFQFLKS